MTILTAIVCCFAFLQLSHVNGDKGDKVVRANPRNEDQVKFLKTLEHRDDIKIDFWKEPNLPGQAVDIEVPNKDYEKLAKLLKEKEIRFNIHIVDVQSLIDSQNKPSGRAGSTSFHGRYHNLNEIRRELFRYNRQFRNSKIISVGRSYEGKSQLGIEIKGASKSNKPIFFLQCGIHAREWVAPATCMYIADQMVSKYGKDNSVTSLLDKMDFIILPVVNVDGYAYTWRGRDEKYRLWRKTRKPNKGYPRCIGTDPNRNWDHEWGGKGASKYPCDQTYRGTRPFSEKETTNVKNYLTGLGSRLKGFIDTHAYSQMWFTPWGYTRADTADHAEQMRVAKAAVTAIYNAGYRTRYQYGSSAVLLYAAAGGSEDWTYGKLRIKYSFGTELRDTGRYGFLLPADQIIPTAREYFEGLKALVAAMRV